VVAGGFPRDVDVAIIGARVLAFWSPRIGLTSAGSASKRSQKRKEDGD